MLCVCHSGKFMGPLWNALDTLDIMVVTGGIQRLNMTQHLKAQPSGDTYQWLGTRLQ